MQNNSTRHDGRASEAPLNKLFKKLIKDGKRWLEAELTLAKAEAGHRLRNFAIAIGLGFAGFLILIGTLVVLAQACVTMLAPHVSGPAIAGLIVGIILLVVVVILALVAKHLLLKKLPPMGSVISRHSGARQRTSRRSPQH